MAHWSIPTSNSEHPLEVTLEPGEIATLVGPNGAGKSALMTWLKNQKSEAPVKQIFAHRRIWLASSGLELTASSREQYSKVLEAHERELASRTDGKYEDKRLSGVLYDLIGMENGRNARIAKLAEEGRLSGILEPSIFGKIAEIMRKSGIGLDFAFTNRLSIDAIQHGNSYPISSMSDGEKGALLLAAEIILAPENSIQLLDEPERHLHRSVSPIFVSELIASRPDCAFVVSTHDLDLVEKMILTNNTIYMVKGVSWTDAGAPTGWDIHRLPAQKPINEAARRAIFGGREDVMFVEGAENSLDLDLYGILFPEFSIYPSGGSTTVQQAVQGLNAGTDFHWISAIGIIDGDVRSREEVVKLRDKRIHVLPVNEVESLYYLPEIVESVARKQAEILNRDPAELYQRAEAQALEAVRSQDVSENLAAINAEKRLRHSALAKLPDKQALRLGKDSHSITVESSYADELKTLQDATSAGDISLIVEKFSIRNSGFRNGVAKALRFSDIQDYQQAVLSSLRNDTALRGKLRLLIEAEPDGPFGTGTDLGHQEE